MSVLPFAPELIPIAGGFISIQLNDLNLINITTSKYNRKERRIIETKIKLKINATISDEKEQELEEHNGITVSVDCNLLPLKYT